MERVFKANLFGRRFRQIQAATANLYRPGAEPVKDSEIFDWHGMWGRALDGLLFDVPRGDLLRYGLMLGRLAEVRSRYSVAEDIFNRLAGSALRGESWIPDPASVLITAGEFNRRRNSLDEAETRYNEALRTLETALLATQAPRSHHQTIGRLFYEFAYLHRLRGDAGAARAMLERSEVECRLADDEVGVEIARTILGIIAYEEGDSEAAGQAVSECLVALERLRNDPEIVRVERDGFARRWVINAQAHLAQIRIGTGDYAGARQLLASIGDDFASRKSVKLIEAHLLLAEGRLDGALQAIAVARAAITEEEGGLNSAEMAAAIVFTAGLIQSLTGSESDRRSAISSFEEACALPADLQNRRAQALAWAARAILASEVGDRVSQLTAIQNGLAAVQRCGTPVRAFLLELLRDTRSSRGAPELADLKELVCSGCFSSKLVEPRAIGPL